MFCKTCRKEVNAKMKKHLRNTMVGGFPDFPGDRSGEIHRGQTVSPVGPPEVVTLPSCPGCGKALK